MRHATPTGRETKGHQTTCAVAPSLPDTLAHCARPRSHFRRRFSVVEKSITSTARANMCASVVGVTGYPRYGRGPRRRAIAPRHSRTLCAATVTLPPPFLGGRKAATSTIRGTFERRYRLRSRIRTGERFFEAVRPLCHAPPAPPPMPPHLGSALLTTCVPNHLLLWHVGAGQEIRGFTTAAASYCTDLRQPRRLQDRRRVPRLLMR